MLGVFASVQTVRAATDLAWDGFVRGMRVNREGMEAAGEFFGERFVDQPMTVDAGQSGKPRRHDGQSKVTFTGPRR